jgi:hypothetical protein
MTKAHFFLFATLLLPLFFTNCVTSTTLPSIYSDKAPTQRNFYLPENFDVVGIDYDLEYTSNVSSAGSYGVSTSTGGASIIKVHAIDKGTREHYLFIYANRSERPIPIEVLHFEEKPRRIAIPVEKKN